MKKLIRKLEEKLGYGIEIHYDSDQGVLKLKSGGNRPPEQNAFVEVFKSEADARRWLKKQIDD